MKLSVARRYKKKHKYLGNLLMKNPVLVLGFDLPFVIATATSLKNAVALSAELFLIHIITMIAAMFTCRRLPVWTRAMANVGVSTIVMVFARQLLLIPFPELTNSVGMYVYLMAVNGMTLFHANYLDWRAKPWPVMVVAMMNVLGFALTMLAVAAVREYAGNGTLWGVPVPMPFKMSGLLIPFSGFILVGFFLAFVKYFNKKLSAYSIMENMRREAHYTAIRPRRRFGE